MKGVLLAAALALGAPPIAAQERPPPQEAPAAQEPPPLSPQCEAPNADIASPAPLPRLAGRLEKGGFIRILSIGSTSTGAAGSSRRKSYPIMLRAILETALKGVKAEIINRGVSGELAQTTADRLRTAVALDKPDLVLWQVGANDALSRVDPEEFKQTLRSTIAWLKDSNIDVVLVGLQYAPQFMKDDSFFAIRDALRAVAASENVLYVRRADAMQFIAQHQAWANAVSDEDRPSDPGYQCTAEHIARAVIASLFVRHRDLPKTPQP